MSSFRQGKEATNVVVRRQRRFTMMQQGQPQLHHQNVSSSARLEQKKQSPLVCCCHGAAIREGMEYTLRDVSRPTMLIRHFSNQRSGGNNNNNTSTRSDQHASFQEQLLELEAERLALSGKDQEQLQGGVFSSSTTSNPSNANALFLDQMKDWKDEQTRLFGTETADNNDDNKLESISKEYHYDELLEDQKQERELLFQFSSQERAAWGSMPNSSFMQQILQDVEAARQQQDQVLKEKSATISSPPSDYSSYRKSQVDESRFGNGHHDEGKIAIDQSSQNYRRHYEFFSHLSQDGNSVHMVDVGAKTVTRRVAHAQTKVILPPSVLQAFLHNDKLVGPKGPIFETAKIAGIMAAKNTSNLIPLCHPMPLDQVTIDIRFESINDENQQLNNAGSVQTVLIDCICKVTHKTGVEMEALTGATVAALTIYDMTKAVSHEICIANTRLITKTGGKRIVKDGKNILGDNIRSPILYLHVGPSGDVWTGDELFAAKHLQPDYVKSISLEGESLALLKNNGHRLIEVLEERSDWALEVYDTGKLPQELRQYLICKAGDDSVCDDNPS